MADALDRIYANARMDISAEIVQDNISSIDFGRNFFISDVLLGVDYCVFE